MNIIFVLIPLTLVLLVFAVWAFFWAVRTRQFENLDVEAWRILMDDEAPPKQPEQDSAEGAQAVDPDLTQRGKPGSKRR